jgi:hypothetical protein
VLEALRKSEQGGAYGSIRHSRYCGKEAGRSQ